MQTIDIARYRILHEELVAPDQTHGILVMLQPGKLQSFLVERWTKRTYTSTGHVSDIFGGFMSKEAAMEEAAKMNTLMAKDSHPNPRTTIAFVVMEQSRAAELLHLRT